MQRFLTYLMELGLIAAGTFVGQLWSNHGTVVPPWLIQFQKVALTPAEFASALTAAVVVHVPLLAVLAWRAGPGVFVSARRTAVDLWALVAGLSAWALYLFLMTAMPFDPNFVAAAALSTFTLFVLAHVVGNVLSRSGRGVMSVPSAVFEMVRWLRSPLVWIALVLASTPLFMAYRFARDRDFANAITRVRIAFTSGVAGEYSLVPAFGGDRFRQPVLVRFDPRNPMTAYVLERHGVLVRALFDRPGGREVLLDISDKLGWVEIENGALGFDFHPEFGNADSARGGYIYLYYTEHRTDETGQHQTNRLSRFDLSLPSPEERRASELVLMRLGRPPSGFHNAGGVEFGPDGFLYVAIGEATQPEARQRIDVNPFGGIFRIDVDERGGDVSHPIAKQPRDGTTDHYFIPSDNPFVGVPDALEEYWALGLRNPFRFSFDAQTGLIWAGDVGSDKWEEVNVVRKGGNYQFPYIEGPEPADTKPANVVGDEASAAYWYQHTAYDRVVIGGVVYRGNVYPELSGQYVFADNYSSKIMKIIASGEHVDQVEVIAQASQFAQRGISSVSTTPDGRILVTVLGSATEPSGEVLLLVSGRAPAQPALPPVASATTISAEEVRSTFLANCSRCHGEAGRGDGPDAAQIDPKPTDFSLAAWQAAKTDAQIETVIRQGAAAGGAGAMMPPWEGFLPEPEIKALVTYVRSLGNPPPP